MFTSNLLGEFGDILVLREIKFKPNWVLPMTTMQNTEKVSYLNPAKMKLSDYRQHFVQDSIRDLLYRKLLQSQLYLVLGASWLKWCIPKGVSHLRVKYVSGHIFFSCLPGCSWKKTKLVNNIQGYIKVCVKTINLGTVVYSCPFLMGSPLCTLWTNI